MRDDVPAASERENVAYTPDDVPEASERERGRHNR
jgi:hypothetical protein